MKKIGLLLVALTLLFMNSNAQPNVYDVFTYEAPEFFTKTELGSKVEFRLANNDTSFCIITLYKSRLANADLQKEIKHQWNEHIFKQLTKAGKAPARILTEQQWDGWTSTLAIGNFYQNKRKCVVMLNAFTKGTQTASVVFAFSDKSFKGPIENFSKDLHLTNTP